MTDHQILRVGVVGAGQISGAYLSTFPGWRTCG